MRAFSELAAAACVLFLSMGAQVAEAQSASSFDAPNAFNVRNLQAMTPSGSVPYTKVFSREENTYWTPDGLSSTSLAGMIIGFGATGLFILYAMIMICMDESKRHKLYEG